MWMTDLALNLLTATLKEVSNTWRRLRVFL